MSTGTKIVRDWEIECERGGFRSQAASFDWLARAIDDALDNKAANTIKKPVVQPAPSNLIKDSDGNSIGYSYEPPIKQYREEYTHTRYENLFPEDVEFISWNRY